MRSKTTFVLGLLLVTAASPAPLAAQSVPTRLATGLEGASGSTVGPDGALYVTEGAAGRISRVDPQDGQVTTFASGLPRSIIGFGGPTDIAFIGNTAYVIVTLVGPQFGGSDISGVYRVDGPASFTVIADIGAFARANPPDTPFGGIEGLQYAIEPYFGGFLVTDGHHNRVLRVALNGRVSEFMTFGNIVPTGLELLGPIVLMGQAGPLPHLPENGKIVAFGPRSSRAITLGSGAPLIVDVEFGPSLRLYGLSQGHFTPGNPEGSPADPVTGALVELKGDGRLHVVVDKLNQPTSLEFIGNTAYVVTLSGEIWKIRNVARPPHRGPH
jgi:DNA-binding beta-propeller fold protein YncE